jgi:hypothetical protein
MFKTFPFKPLFSILFLIQLVACDSENATNSHVQLIDSVSAQTIDSSGIKQDTALSQQTSEEEEDGEPDDVRDYDFYGLYIGSDINRKLDIKEGRFQYFYGPQLKMKGTVSLGNITPSSDSMYIFLNSTGRTPKLIPLVTYWGNPELETGDMAQWILFEGDTLYRQKNEDLN